MKTGKDRGILEHPQDQAKAKDRDSGREEAGEEDQGEELPQRGLLAHTT